jgi:hypothetical protein
MAGLSTLPLSGEVGHGSGRAGPVGCVENRNTGRSESPFPGLTARLSQRESEDVRKLVTPAITPRIYGRSQTAGNSFDASPYVCETTNPLACEA